MGIKTRIWGLAGVGALAAASLLVPAAPAGAANATLSASSMACNFGQFPNQAGGQSNLNVSCNFPAARVSPYLSISDFPAARYHQGSSRTMTMKTTTGSAATSISYTGSPTTVWITAADVNHQVSGVGIAPYTTIKSVSSSTKSGKTTVSITFNKPIVTGNTKAAVQIDNSSIRQVNTAAFTSGSTTVTSSTANFTSADIGRSIDATQLPSGTTIASVTSATTAVLSDAATASKAVVDGVGAVISIGSTENVTSARVINGLTSTRVANSMTGTAFAATGNDWILDAGFTFGAGDINQRITGNVSSIVTINDEDYTIPGGTCAAADTYITGVSYQAAAGFLPAGMKATLNKALTGNCDQVVVGNPSVNAPENGDVVAQLNSTLILNPALVAGSPACSENTPFGTTLAGQWFNPGSYETGALGTVYGAGSKGVPYATVAQIAYKTAVTTFYGYVAQTPAGSNAVNPLEQQAAAHYNVTFPVLPTGFAICSGTGTSTNFRFFGSSTGTSKVATGVGRPGNSLRGIQRPASETDTQTAYIVGVGGTPINANVYGPISAIGSGTCDIKQVGVFGQPCGD